MEDSITNALMDSGNGTGANGFYECRMYGTQLKNNGFQLRVDPVYIINLRDSTAFRSTPPLSTSKTQCLVMGIMSNRRYSVIQSVGYSKDGPGYYHRPGIDYLIYRVYL